MDHQLWIDGAWSASRGGRALPIENPASGEKLGDSVDASRADVD